METNAAVEKTPTGKSGLLRVLGLGFGLAIGVGSAIGVGILRTPGMVASNLDGAGMIIGVWMLGGLVALLGANAYSELATMLPEAGGGYVYIRRAYGDFLGFAGGFNDFLLSCCGGAYIAITFGEYFGQLFPPFAGRENAVAVAILVLLTVLNWIGLRAGDIAQQVTSVVKVAALLVLVAACFAFGGGAASVPHATAVTSANPWLFFGAVILSLQAVMETYAGWNSAVYFAEENEDPGRAIPRSLFGGVAIVTAIYVLMNAALLYVMPISQIAATKLPAADAAQLIFGDLGGKVITVMSLASILGILNAMVLYTPRIFFAMSRDGFFPIQGAKVNTGGTPTFALLLTVILIAAFAMSGTFETLLAIAAFLGLAGDSFVYLSLFVLRRKEPDLPRPFRAIGYPILPAVVLVAAWVILIGYVASNTTNSLISIGILLLIYPIYLLSKAVSKRQQSGADSV